MSVDEYNIEDARRTFGDKARDLLSRLRDFVFNSCVQPIKLGLERGAFDFLDLFYSPLFALLGNGDFWSPRTQWIFTTNWDLCLTQWLDYAMRDTTVEDGIKLDRHREPLFSPEGWTNGTNDVARRVVPLHGNLGLIKRTRVIRGGIYQEIQKVPLPVKYFEGNPSEIANLFMIFPLEAVGYEQSVRSPYLDMLNLLKERLRSETDIFVIGSSLRDPTIASIFEETLRERAQTGDWRPIPHLDKPVTEEETQRYSTMQMRVFLIGSSPREVIEYLDEHGYTNLVHALIPIEATSPEMIDQNGFDLEPLEKVMGKMLSDLFDRLNKYGLELKVGAIQQGLTKMGLKIPFPS